MATKVVKLGDLSSELSQFADRHIEERKVAVHNGMLRSLPDLVAASPVDTGQYAASWDFSITETGAVLGNFAPHAPIIEKGARPFKPPLGPLLAWAKRVLGSASQPPDYDSEVWGLAIGTQKKIEKFGMQPRNILENMLPTIIANIEAEFKKIG